MLKRNESNIAALLPVMAATSLLFAGSAYSAEGWDPTSKASNTGSIVNTRHNLTQSYLPSGFSGFMDYARNNYGEVCVYCHTPHGANSQSGAPLWNRTINTGSYTTYNFPLMSEQTPTQPGSASVACLSCHDGTIAIDSIINMPGPGRYLKTQETSQNILFLDKWQNPSGIETIDHGVMWSGTSGYFSGPYNCNRCHTEGNVWGIADFGAFNLGEDLINDHPIGVALPSFMTYDFRASTKVIANRFEYYDDNGNNKVDKNELRFYFDGTDYRVECASCHDPHGVAPAAGGEMYPAFLRKSNINSDLCLTCHIK